MARHLPLRRRSQAWTNLEQLARALAAFEASESQANTGTGSRREGEHFEGLVRGFWASVATLAGEVATRSSSFVARKRAWQCVECGGRSILLPAESGLAAVTPHHVREDWLELTFGVKDLVSAFPGNAEAVSRYAPSEDQFAGEQYFSMFDGLSTKFDGAVLLVENGVLREKILLEYKTAKSSAGRQLDGNAHERLSFQIMQYLEVATRYPRCSFVVMANDAFIRYRNKYHVNFHVQADRLANFAWFRMHHFCTASEHLAFADALLDWLEDGSSWHEKVKR